ncbi:MAG: biopolymer transporter ExbD [Chromatiales bacterium]|nr:biopolymer transporter ExbD [Chromatiales bacterium]
MGMNVSSGGGDGDGEVLNAINTTPLVDVMLVLLIIFLITIPVITKTVPLDLPKASNIATQTKPENITIAIDRQGNIYWNDSVVTSNEQLLNLIKAAAMVQPQPEIHIRGDSGVRYEYVGRVITLVQRGGIAKVGFISWPQAGG